MGWTYMHQPREGWKKYLDSQITWTDEKGKARRCLDSAIVNRRVYYAAMEIAEPGKPTEVVAIIMLLDFRPKDSYPFGYKDMDETMGPVECECPERIFKLLTPTDYPYALDWRERVKEVHAHRKWVRGLSAGDRFIYREETFTVTSRKPKTVATDQHGNRYRFPPSYLKYAQPAP